MLTVYFDACRIPMKFYKHWIGVDPIQRDNPQGTNVRLEVDSPYRRIVLRMTNEQAMLLHTDLGALLTARERMVNIPRPPWRKRASHFEHAKEPEPEDTVRSAVREQGDQEP